MLPAQSATDLPAQARALASRLPPLLVASPHTVANTQQGVHGRLRAGSGEHFWQFRRYAPGDPAQRIDWRQSARTDKFFVREQEYEAAQRVYLWADDSGSMRYASAPDLPSKAARAQLLSLALASLLQRGGEQVFWLQAGASVSLNSAQGLERAAALLATVTPAPATAPALPPARQAHWLLASDFLLPEPALRQLIADASARHSAGVLLHIADPLEDDFTLDGRVELRGCENEAALLLPDAAALRDAYQDRMTQHKALLQRLATGAGWTYIHHRTDAAPVTALLQLHQAFGAG